MRLKQSCAIEEGLKLAMQWSQLPIAAETDCSEALELIKEGTPNISVYAFRISIFRYLLKERGSSLAKISRDANGASHELARLGRVHHRTQVWLMEFPVEISDAIAFDCNSLKVQYIFLLSQKKI
jgi:hypothetical protein